MTKLTFNVHVKLHSDVPLVVADKAGVLPFILGSCRVDNENAALGGGHT